MSETLRRGSVAVLAALSLAAAEAGAQDGAALTMDAAVAAALSHSARVAQARLEMEGQTERKRSAWSDVGPRVSAAYNEVHFEDKQEIQMGPSTILLRDKVSKTGSLTVAQPLTGGVALARRAQMESTQAELKARGLEAARIEAGYQAAEIWLRVYQAERQTAVAAASVAAAENQMRDAKAMERVGRMNRGDVLKLELAVSDARARAAQARAFLETSMAALREAVGLDMAAAVQVDGRLPAVPDGEPDLPTAVGRALRDRIEPVMARGGVEVARFGRQLVYSQFSPGVNAFVKWDRNFGEAAGFGGDDKLSRTYGIQATWDLWNNGSGIFQVREAAANIAKAEAGVQGLESGIRLEVTQAHAALRSAREQLLLARTADAQAAEAYRIEKARFGTGTRSATDLVLAETAASGARARLVAVETDLIASWLRLERAMGGRRPLQAGGGEAEETR